MNRREPSPRLVLFSPPFDAERAAALIADACDAADVASVVLRTGAISDAEILARAKALLPSMIEDGAALLLEDRADLVEAAKADGAHAANFPAHSANFSFLKARYVVGAAGLASRHDAMTAAEAGADYVMFGEFMNGKRPPIEAIVERVSWWAEVFVIPCVAFAGALEEIPALARAGADFVALDEAVWRDSAPLEALAKATTHLQFERAG